MRRPRFNKKSGEDQENFEMAERSTEKIRPGKWVRGNTGHDSLRSFNRWIFMYRRWIHLQQQDMDQVLTPSQKWERLIATGGADLQHIIMEASVITHENSVHRPTPMDRGIDWIREAIPRIQSEEESETRK